jgi:hypothetical protein
MLDGKPMRSEHATPRLGQRTADGRSPHWLKSKNPASAAVHVI